MPGSAYPDPITGPNAPSLGDQGHGLYHIEDRRRLDALEAGGRAVPADYMLTRSGTTYRLIDGLSGVEVGNGAEPGALVQTATTALGTGGGLIALTGREDFEWASVPTVPAGITRRLTIRSTGPVVNLTTNGPRFLDPAANPPAGATFRNLTLDGIVLDATAIKDNAQGHHLLFGNVRAGGSYAQINFSGLRFRRCKALNTRATGTGAEAQVAVALATFHTTAGQAQNFITDVLVEDVEQTGGMHCFFAVAYIGGLTGADVPDVWVDGITVRNLRHDIGSASTGFTSSSHVHIGSWAKVGRCTVENVYGYGSRDVGIEINNFQDATVDGGVFEEYNGFAVLYTNHRAPLRVAAQRGEIRNVTGSHLATNNAVLSTACSVFTALGKENLPLGAIEVKGVKYHRNRAELPTAGIGGWIEGEARSFTVEDVTCVVESVAHTTNDAGVALFYSRPANLSPVRLRNINTRASGTVSGTGHVIHGVRVFGSLVLDAEDLRVGLDLTGAPDFATRGMDIGSQATTIKGTIRGFKLGPMAATQPRGIVISGSATTTIPTRLDIIDADFSGNAATSLDVAVGAGNEHLVLRRPGSTWKVAPAPAAITVGTSPFSYRNLSGFRQRVIVRGGTVSEVAWSRDNAVFTVVNTTTGVVIEVENGEYVRVTYSAAPTMTAIPVA